jgi:hypothetical protein
MYIYVEIVKVNYFPPSDVRFYVSSFLYTIQERSRKLPLGQMTWSILVLLFLNGAVIGRDGRDSAVGIVTSYRLDGRGVGVRVPVRSRIFLHDVRTGRGAHPASYPIGTGGKAARA